MRTSAKQRAPRQRVPVAGLRLHTVGSHRADGQRSTKTAQPNKEQNKHDNATCDKQGSPQIATTHYQQQHPLPGCDPEMSNQTPT